MAVRMRGDKEEKKAWRAHSHGAPGGSALPLLAQKGGCLRFGASVPEERKVLAKSSLKGTLERFLLNSSVDG